MSIGVWSTLPVFLPIHLHSSLQCHAQLTSLHIKKKNKKIIIFFFFHKNCNKHFTIALTKKIHSGEGRKSNLQRQKRREKKHNCGQYMYQYIKGPCISVICWVLWTYIHTHTHTHIYIYSIYSCRITCECSESARERRIAL